MKTNVPCIVAMGVMLLSHEGRSDPSGATSSSANHDRHGRIDDDRRH